MEILRGKSTILALTLVSVLLAGCGGDGGDAKEDTYSEYPVIEAADYSGMELDTVSNDKLSYSYPAGQWEFIWEDPLQIAQTETMGTGKTVNINMNLEAQGQKGDGWMDDVMDQLSPENFEEQGDSMDIRAMEIRTLNGEPVVYMEVVTKITDEMLDMMIDSGVYTEEMLEDLGGREALLAIPPTTQIAIYTVKDGTLFSCTGTYFGEEQKQVVLDTMAVMIATVEEK